MDPYRAPQSLPPPPRDAMRPVLIVAGVLAGMIAAAAIAVYVAERVEHRPPSTTIVAKPPPPAIDEAAQAQPETPKRPYTIGQGIVIDGAVHGDVGPKFSSNPFDFSFAVFGEGQRRALTMFKTEHGHYEVELIAGRTYDLCWGGDPEPVCNRTIRGGKLRVQNCPPRDLDCTCTPADRTRLAWRVGCERVRVDSVTLVSAGIGMAGPSHIGFTCVPADACTKGEVSPVPMR